MELTLLGIGLGLAAGASPGPLSALLVAVSVDRGFHAGARVAMAPLLSDAPIVMLSLLLLKDLPVAFLGGLTLLGGLFLGYLGAESLGREDRAATAGATPSAATKDLWQGAAVNFLNPHPWMFWMSVGAPTLVSGWRRDPLDAIGYLIGFYVFIVGSKLALAWLSARGGQALQGGPWMERTIKLCGLLLLILGALLCYRGIVQMWTGLRPAPEALGYLT
jgi:threonine/homoserine/homoserine lactone efflux protein